jgi:hypothetical protein
MAMSGLTAKGPPAGLPKFLLYIRIVIIVLSLIILALAAYAISIFGSVTYYYGSYNGAAGLLIFTVSTRTRRASTAHVFPLTQEC